MIEAACARYELSEAELAEWLAAFVAHGDEGLRATRIQALRGQF